MNDILSPGQMIKVLMPMEGYPHRAKDEVDFNDLLYGNVNSQFSPGDTLTIVDTSAPAFHKDDTWYMAVAPGGGVVWLIDAHSGVYYEPI